MRSQQTSTDAADELGGGPGWGLRRVLLGAPRLPVAERSTRQRVAALIGGGWDVAAFGYLALAGLVAVSRRVGGVAPVVLQPLQATFPIVVLPAALVAAVALLRRRGLQLVLAVLLCAIGWFAVAPARRGQGVVASNGMPTMTLLQANVLDVNPSPDKVAALIADRDADVVAVEEVSPAIDIAFRKAGLYDQYPYRQVTVSRGPESGALFSKFPFERSESTGAPSRFGLPDVVLLRPGAAPVRLVLVHPFPPLAAANARIWSAELQRLAKQVDRDAMPTIAVGDFNATRWQPAFGAILGAGARDVHEALGRGLSVSWPMRMSPLRPFVRLDHALVWNGVVPVSVEDFDLPGSDHRGFVVTLALPVATDRQPAASDPPPG